MERVTRKLSDTQRASAEYENTLREYIFGIMKEMQEQAPKEGIPIIRTPVENFIITREGFKYQEKPDYVPVVSESPFKFFERLGEMYRKGGDFIAKAEAVINVLKIVQNENKLNITGKYLPKEK